MLDKIKLCFLSFSILQIFKDVVERIPLALSRLGLFVKVSRQVVETAAGADLRIKSLKGGRGDYGLTRLFVKDAQIGCATNYSMH